MACSQSYAYEATCDPTSMGINARNNVFAGTPDGIVKLMVRVAEQSD
jgi:hypothetical protein